MSYPTQPNLSLAFISTTSFSAIITGADSGTTNTVYYQLQDQRIQPSSVVNGGSVVGNGTVTVSGVTALSHPLVWVVSDNGSSFSLPTHATISLCSPSTLLQAIKSLWYNTTSLTSLITNGLYLSQVPDTQGSIREDLPYATCDSESTRFEWTETKLFYEVTTLEFNVWTPGSAANIEQMVQEIRSAFDWTTLTFTDGVTTSTYVQPLSFNFSVNPVRYRDNSLVYQASLRYEAWINRTFSPYN